LRSLMRLLRVAACFVALLLWLRTRRFLFFFGGGQFIAGDAQREKRLVGQRPGRLNAKTILKLLHRGFRHFSRRAIGTARVEALGLQSDLYPADRAAIEIGHSRHIQFFNSLSIRVFQLSEPERVSRLAGYRSCGDRNNSRCSNDVDDNALHKQLLDAGTELGMARDPQKRSRAYQTHGSTGTKDSPLARATILRAGATTNSPIQSQYQGP
jgi:hypothetical protein